MSIPVLLLVIANLAMYVVVGMSGGNWLNVPPGALVRPKDPFEYFRKLRFHQAVTGVRDYGIDA